jgi:hypothetical protein
MRRCTLKRSKDALPLSFPFSDGFTVALSFPFPDGFAIAVSIGIAECIPISVTQFVFFAFGVAILLSFGFT